MPAWQPGQSGNPSGRPVTPEHIKKAFREMSDEAMAYLWAVIRGQTTAEPRDVLRAIELVHDRAYGRVPQSIDAEVTDLTPILFDPSLVGLVKTAAVKPPRKPRISKKTNPE